MPKQKNYRELALLEGTKPFPVQGIIGWRWDAPERRQFRAVFPNKTYGNTLWQYIQRELGWVSQRERHFYPPTSTDHGTIKYPHMVEITWPPLWIDEEQFSAEARELIEGFLAQHREPVEEVQEEQNLLDQLNQNANFHEEANTVAEEADEEQMQFDVAEPNMALLDELEYVRVAGEPNGPMPQVPEAVAADEDVEKQECAFALLELAGQLAC